MSVAPPANVNVHLTRINGHIPWGFRMSGGADFSSPLAIQRVTPGTVAANSGVLPGDIIVQINGMHTGLMKHKDAQQIILSSGNTISFGLQRKYYAVLPRDVALLTMEKLSMSDPKQYRPSTKYAPNPRAAPASPGHGDAYIAPGYAYQAPNSGPQVPGYAPEQRDLPTKTTFKSTTITASKGSRMAYSGSILNPQAAPEAAPSRQPSQQAFSPKPVAFNPPSAGTPQMPMSPPVKQAAPKPWVPSDGSSGKMRDLPCGDSTAHRGTSTYHEAAPLDPSKVPVCSGCSVNIRGPFIVALNKCWCPSHFTCAKCRCELINMGFVELNNQIYCEKDYETHFAPKCSKCSQPIMGDTVTALKKTWHKACFLCTECKEPISMGAFHVEDGNPYCINDWQRLFQTKCAGCDFPVEPGDRWIEALEANWHSECFACNVCNCPLEGKPFFARDRKPFCKGHAGAAAR